MWLHRCARALGWVAGVTVILLAVTVALAQLLLPLLAAHPAWVAAQLSQRLHRPVSIASMEGRRSVSGPMLVMHDVTIGAAPGETGAALQIPESVLKLDAGGWLWPSRHLFNLHVRGLQLDLARGSDGQWRVNGIGPTAGQPVSLGRLSMDLWLSDLRVNVADTKLDRHYQLHAGELRLSRQGSRIRVGGTLQREGVPGALRVAGRFREDGSSGKLWLGADEVDMKSLLDGIDMDGYTVGRGHGKLAAWVDWRQGRVSGALLRFDLADLDVSAADGGRASVPSLHGIASLRQIDDGYDVRWAGDDGGALALTLHQPDGAQAHGGVAARNLQLAPLVPWLALKPGLAPGLAQWLGGGHPQGELSRVALRWSRADGLQTVDLAFKNLGIEPSGKLPGVTGLHGELRGDAAALSLELPAQTTTLRFPHLFEQPLVLSKLAGTLALWSQDGRWHVGVDTLDFAGIGYAGQARGEVILPEAGGHPFLDMYATVERADVTAAKQFWPIGSMSPGTIAWLNRALVSGTIEQAQVLVRGDMGDWPFRHNEGRFEARAPINDLVLDYAGHWPKADNIRVVANFVNNGMLAEASGGQSLGVKADKAVALIPDFGESLLDLNVQGSGRGGDVMAFVGKSPIGSHEADTLARLKLGGNATFDFHLVLPLKHDEDAVLTGSALLKDADFSAPAWGLKLDKLNGPLRFDARGLQADALSAGFRGQPSTLKLAIAGGTGDPATVLSAQLNGNYRVDDLISDRPSLDWLGKVADGRSGFAIGYTIVRAPGSTAATQTLSIDSPMDGIRLDLPAPLNKPAATSLPLHLTMGLPVDGGDLQVALGQRMRGHFRLADGAQKPLAATLAFGEQMPQTLPQAGLRIRGHADRLDVTGWVQHVAADSDDNGPGLESIDVSTDHAEWFGRSLGAMKIRAEPQPEVLSLDVDGASMAGNFSIPRQELGRRGVTVRLQRLYWPKDPADSGASPKPAAAVPAETAAVASEVTPEDPAKTGIDPASVPPLHLWAHDLRLGEARLGEARLETWPTADGMHIDQLRALSSRVQITASGDWNGTADNSRTHMRIEFAAENLGDMLGALGYEGLVSGGKTHDQLDASWPGSPSALALVNMSGTLSVRVSDGRIPEVTPGVGRLFGLVSLAELPRRLTLDFGDVFGKGLAFDSISGDFKLADGNATTGNLLIHGPAAKISITGRTGLRAKDYDQQVVVVPHVGNSLPIVGAVVGGPIGAAAGFAVQGLLGKGLNQAAKASYRITGSWDKPVMTLIEKHGPAAAPAPPLLAPAEGLPTAVGSVLLPPAASSVLPPAAASSVRP